MKISLFLHTIYTKKEARHTMKISDLLNLPTFSDFKLLAGQSGVNHQITSVNILDNPKAMNWLSPGELIVTSGYFFSESSDALEDFLKSFHQLNIPGICIKPQVYLNPIPELLIDLCNELTIPLIEIPYGIAFSKILTTVMNLLTEDTNKATQLTLETNTKFLEYGLKGKGLDYLKEKLESLLNQPVIITDSHWVLLTKPTTHDFDSLINQEQQLTLFDTSKIVNLPVNLSKSAHPISLQFDSQKNGVLLPLFFNDVTYGYIIVLQKNQAILQQDYLNLQQAALTIAMEIVHQTEKSRIQNKISREFYQKLLHNSADINELKQYDTNFNFDLSYTVFMIDFKHTQSNYDDLQASYNEDSLLRHLQLVIETLRQDQLQVIHLFKQGNSFIGLIGNVDNHFFTLLHKQLLFYFKSNADINLLIGSTQPVPNLPKSYQEVRHLIRYLVPNQSDIYRSENFYFDNFLQQRIPTTEAQNFISHYLAPLIDYDNTHNSQFLETLDCFLNHQQNIAETARALFIHRNTLLYRIEKIESLLGISLKESENVLPLMLALKLIQRGEKSD